MPLQNRVDPAGQFHALTAHGNWLGNRGILHDSEKQIVAPWKHKAWVTCRLEFKGRRREIFAPNNYSELFFLDEATAFSAGHRPCAECRRERFNEFKASWSLANPQPEADFLSAAQIDRQLHVERAMPGGGKVTFGAQFEELPSGAFIDQEGEALLKWHGRLYRWSAQGYCQAAFLPTPSELVQVLTPASVVRMFLQGFQPQVHESAVG